jgi:hypothetical protein
MAILLGRAISKTGWEMRVAQLSSPYTMSLNIPWYRVARILQTSLAIAVFATSVYSSSTLYLYY